MKGLVGRPQMAVPELIIIGAAGTCVDIAEAARLAGMGERLLGFLDDAPELCGAKRGGFPVLGPLKHAARFPQAKFVFGIGSTRTHRRRLEMIARLRLLRSQFATVVHPAAVVSPSARLGRGNAILAGASLGNSVRLADHVIVLQNCVVGHDTTVGAGAIMAAGAVLSGSTRIGRECYIGAGSVLREGARMGSRSLLGAGAVLLDRAPRNCVFIGVPARPMK